MTWGGATPQDGKWKKTLFNFVNQEKIEKDQRSINLQVQASPYTINLEGFLQVTQILGDTNLNMPLRLSDMSFLT